MKPADDGFVPRFEALEPRVLLSGDPQLLQLLRDVNLDTAASMSMSGANPSPYVEIGGTIFFVADDGQNGQELWKTDGTPEGTVMVKDIAPSYDVGSNPKYLTNLNGTLFFSATGGLWKSDGTEAGTVVVSPLFSSGQAPGSLININGELYFAASVSEAGVGWAKGWELYKSDGTAAGTGLVKDIRPGSGDAFPSRAPTIVSVNGTAFFVADDGTNGQELWKSDGTEAGTLLVKDIRPGIASSNIGCLTNVNGTLFFRAEDGTNGQELWKSDGTAAGTVMVKDIRSGASGSNLDFLTNVKGTLFFRANDGTLGDEL